jgi:SAM-dependent methyltransferase
VGGKMNVVDNWQRYFRERNEGLGTTYERFVLHRHFERLNADHGIESVLECPSFGMTGVSGINSLWWAKRGARVTVMDDDVERTGLIRRVWEDLSLEGNIHCGQKEYVSLPFENDAFDLGWNFAALWFVPELELFLEELSRVTKKVILICIPNTSNVFCILRLMSQKNAVGFYPQNLNSARITNTLLKLNWCVFEQGYLDVPPWPDIAMNKEDLVEKLGFDSVAKRLRQREGSDICILDYFSGKAPDMENEILKYSFLENLPNMFKRVWAHHRYFIFTPR